MQTLCIWRASIPTWGLSVWSLHVVPVYAWVLSGYSGFLPLSKNMHVRLIGDSKIVPKIASVWLFVSFVSQWPCDGLATCPGMGVDTTDTTNLLPLSTLQFPYVHDHDDSNPSMCSGSYSLPHFDWQNVWATIRWLIWRAGRSILPSNWFHALRVTHGPFAEHAQTHPMSLVDLCSIG